MALDGRPVISSHRFQSAIVILSVVSSFEKVEIVHQK